MVLISCSWKWLLHFHMCFAVGSVVLLSQPRDVRVREGGTAVFNCSFSSINHFPWWKINGAVYSFDMLPSRHSYHSRMLSVVNVKAADNASTYQCLFLDGTNSNIATLYIVNPEGDDATVFTSISASPLTPVPNLATSYLEGALASQVQWSSRVVPMTDNEILLTDLEHNSKSVILYGALGGCGTFLIAFAIVTAVLLAYKFKKHQKQSAATLNATHQYEDIQELQEVMRGTDPPVTTPAGDVAADCTITQLCPAYAVSRSGRANTPVVPQKQHPLIIRTPGYANTTLHTRNTSLQLISPSSQLPDVTTEYRIIQCPAYAESGRPITPDVPPHPDKCLYSPQYKTQELPTAMTANASSNATSDDRILTGCPAYAWNTEPNSALVFQAPEYEAIQELAIATSYQQSP